MECKQIPHPDSWDNETPENLEQFRVHLHFCKDCREKILQAAPEKLLFDLKTPMLPDEFWLGFWDCIERKHTSPRLVTRASRSAAAALRWAAVIVIGVLVFTYGRQFPENEPLRQIRAGDYPVIENIQKPEAHYYIIQTREQKVVMFFDPGIEL